MSDNYGYDPRETDFDPTVNYYPPPPQYAPPGAPMPPNTMADQPTSQAASTAQPIYVPYPVVVSDDGDSMALSSLIFGIISAAVGWIPVRGCGGAALRFLVSYLADLASSLSADAAWLSQACCSPSLASSWRSSYSFSTFV